MIGWKSFIFNRSHSRIQMCTDVEFSNLVEAVDAVRH